MKKLTKNRKGETDMITTIGQSLKQLIEARKEITRLMRKNQADAESIGYAIGYCRDKHVGNPLCKHEGSHAMYESKTRNGVETHIREVCCGCGKLSVFNPIRVDKQGRPFWHIRFK